MRQATSAHPPTGIFRLNISAEMTPHQGPVISVVTVVYNGGTVLEATIRSVLEQEYPAIEYIIVDGGSSDNTKVVLQKYSDRITQWVSEPDNGIYDAMNKAVRMVSGEWVIFMNAGDRKSVV